VPPAGPQRPWWLLCLAAALVLSPARASVAASCSVAADCDDQNPCTDDACDPQLGCVHANNTAPCDDGNACTTDDRCQDGRCVGGPRLNCDDANPCTDDICDPARGCLHANNSAPCTDGNGCTTGDVCHGGVCVGGDTASGCSACEAVATIPPEGGTFVGETAGPSWLESACGGAAAPERVYSWTPAASGVAVISTCGDGTSFETVLSLRRDRCETGAEVACNETGCGAGNRGSRITVPVTAGQTSFIVVDGAGDAQGTYSLTVVPPSKCGNGVREASEQCDGADSARCPSGQCGSDCKCVPPPGGLPDLVPEIADVSFARAATVDPGDVAEGCAESTSGVDLLRFTVRALNLGTADYVLGDPQCPAPCSAHPLETCGNPEFMCSPAAGHNHGHYSNFARYELLDAHGQATVVGHKQGFCLLDNLCDHHHYTCAYQGLSAGCGDVYSAALGCQYLDVTAVPPGDYVLRVTLDPFGRIEELDPTNNVATLPVTIPPPPPPPCDPATCVDDDPCTLDHCAIDGCHHDPLTGFDAVVCAVQGGEPSACAGESMPAAAGRRLARARTLIEAARAAGAPGRARSLVARAVRSLRRASRRSRRVASPACAAAFRTLVDDARARAERWLAGA